MSNYWRSIEEKELKIVNEPEEQPKAGLLGMLEQRDNLKANRRDFLKLFGFSVGVAAVASSCQQPVQKAIPYLIKPENITPGKASFFASSVFIDNQFCSILAKVRDGRPIKVEGNELSPISKGATTARIQGSLLSLYDTHRYKKPQIKGKDTDWSTMDQELKSAFDKLKAENKKFVILTSSIISPSTNEALDAFIKNYPNCETITYDAISASGMLDANIQSFGIKAIPTYRFDQAKVIVNFGADFLGTWIDPIRFSKDFSSKRQVEDGSINKLIQYESNMSLTGSNADKRIVIKPSEERVILTNLYNAIAKKTGASVVNTPESAHDISETADLLLHNKGKSIVLSGSNNTDCQLIVNAINQLLKNYGSTIDLNETYTIKQGLDLEFSSFLNELDKNEVGGIIFYNTNPAYNISGFKDKIKNIELLVSLSSKPDETAELVQYVCPDHNPYESWNDFEPVKGHYHLGQPTIAPIFETRQAQESFLKWAGVEDTYYDFIKAYWNKELYPKNSSHLTFSNFWNTSLQDGYCYIAPSNKNLEYNNKPGIASLQNTKHTTNENIELCLYEKVGIGSGELANIPWLQEMPDPITKATWDNYLTISPKYAKEQNLKTGDVVNINGSVKAPVYIQPGQAYGTVGLALGYGRTNAGLVATNTGVNANPLIPSTSLERQSYITDVKIEKTGDHNEISVTQTHHSMEGRALIRETTIAEYLDNPSSGNEMHEQAEHHRTTLYKEHEYPGHHWGMAIDLTKCTGCSACVVACQVENNIPVVGKTEVKRVHEMHWIRIDRYYNGNEDNPEVVRQPVMCQHCDNAPCENVCPVAATNHSTEGLNQMAYNRCIGTRYCNNNCPYKVRRFNYFDYNGADSMKGNEHDLVGLTLDLPRMVLNPDVTIRAKGVIEKCSFCVQRIQDRKLNAKLEDRELTDGEIKPACAQTCTADAIVFGDLNDKNSKVSKHFANKRNYHLLEELHTLPSVGYLTKVRNKKAGPKEATTDSTHGHHEG